MSDHFIKAVINPFVHGDCQFFLHTPTFHVFYTYNIPSLGACQGNGCAFVAVGMPVSPHPPHRSRRAELPHRALASGRNARLVVRPAVPVPAHCQVSRHCVRCAFRWTGSPWPTPFPPPSPRSFQRLCSKTSPVLWNCPTPCFVHHWLVSSRLPNAASSGSIPRRTWDLPVPVHGVSVRAQGLRPRRVRASRAMRHTGIAFRLRPTTSTP